MLFQRLVRAWKMLRNTLNHINFYSVQAMKIKDNHLCLIFSITHTTVLFKLCVKLNFSTWVDSRERMELLWDSCLGLWLFYFKYKISFGFLLENSVMKFSTCSEWNLMKLMWGRLRKLILRNVGIYFMNEWQEGQIK